MKSLYVEPENYLIDRKLKQGKGWPEPTMAGLAYFFKTKSIPQFKVPKEMKRQIERQAGLIEQTFLDYFLSKAKIKPDFFLENDAKERVNRKLKYMEPVMVPDGKGGYTLAISPKNQRELALAYWLDLARMMDSQEGLDPSLIRLCPFCKRIFFSRQQKRFHSQCRSKYFSEKYVRGGLAKTRQKEYRERQKINMKGRKTA